MASPNVKKIGGVDLPSVVGNHSANLARLVGEVFVYHDKDACGYVSPFGISKVRNLCVANSLLVPPMQGNERLTWELQTARGKWPKRYQTWAKWYRENHFTAHELASDAQLAELGQICEQYTVKDHESFFVTVAGPPFDWPLTFKRDGRNHNAFGHKGGSCWYTGEAGNRHVDKFISRGGYAILFYSDSKLKLEDGVARIWAVPDGDTRFVVFNGYYQGFKQTGKLAEMIAHAMGLSCKTLEHFCATGVYVNSDNIKGSTGYVIGEAKHINEVERFCVW